MITLRTLGPVDASVDGHAPPPELLWRKNLALLIYLARSPRATRTREHLLGLLWADKPESSARHSLREAIRVLRSAGGDAMLGTDGDQLRLESGAVATDVDQLDSFERSGDLAGAAALAVGDFLEGFGIADAPAFEDWLATERLAIRRRLLDILVRRAAELQRAGDLAGATSCAQRALALDDTMAAAVRAVMGCLALQGERAAALAAYDAYASRLREGVGTEPDDVTRRLAEQVRREKVWREIRPTARGAESRRAPLVGRDAELARLIDVWNGVRGGRAAVALIGGPPGVGRTRLAEEVAARARLDGAACAHVRGTASDRQDPWSGVHGLGRGGLLDAAGVPGAAPNALALFASRNDAWADRFPAARGTEPLFPGAALTATARAAAGEQPLLLVLDDAHLLDGETLELLHALLRDLASLPVMVLATAAGQPPREELDTLRSRTGREIPGAVIALEAFGPEPLRRLAHWAMPAYTDVEVDRLARRLGADSAGLPLLAVELLHAVALGLDLQRTDTAWPQPQRTLDQTLPSEVPEALTAAIRIGFRRLSKNAQAVLVAAAVADGRVDVPRLARATDLEPNELADALDETEWQRWLVADARGYSFVARIARDVVVRDMVTKGQRQRLEERLKAVAQQNRGIDAPAAPSGNPQV